MGLAANVSTWNATAKTVANEKRRNETWIAWDWIAVDCPINHTYVMLNR